MSYDRVKGAPWFETASNQDITIVGAGGIGSWLSLMISRTNPRSIDIIDPDIIEEHNMTGQLYRRKDVNSLKAAAISGIVREFGFSNSIFPIPCEYTINNKHIVFGALDNMTTRKKMFLNWKTYIGSRDVYHDTSLFVDGRLTAEQLQIFAIRGIDKDRIEIYEKEHLFDSSEVIPQPCTFKQTSHMAAMIASMMTNIYVNHLTNIAMGRDIYSVPFFTEYFGPTTSLQKS